MDRVLIDEIKAKSNLITIAADIGGISTAGVSGTSYSGPCPTGHASVSNRCFSMSSEVFHCFSCNIKGDVIHYVQDIKFKGRSPETFFLALQFLAERLGIHLPDAQAQFCKEDYEKNEIGRKVLSEAAKFYHGLLSTESRQFLLHKYALTEDTINSVKIGYSQGNGLLKHLPKAGFTADQALLSGLFLRFEGTGSTSIVEHFNHRLVFPYFKHGHVSYFIGRKAEKTPTKDYDQGEYKKLLTHDVSKGRTYIAPGIQNDTIFNQDILFMAKDVVITEGITDCIALHQYGFSAISPVTIRFRKKDADVIERLLRKDQTIFMSNDNDFNAAGEDGAFDTALALSLKGFTVKMMTIPLEEKQKNARNKLDALEK